MRMKENVNDCASAKPAEECKRALEIYFKSVS